MKKEKIKRVKLRSKLVDRTFVLKKEVPVMISGFGSNMGSILIGKLISVNNRAITVKLKDEDGFYFEKYHTKNGKRLKDLRSESGWKVNLKDINLEKKSCDVYHINDKKLIGKKGVVLNKKKNPEIILLSKEEFLYNIDDPLSDRIVIEIWNNKTEDFKYLQCYRTGILEKIKGGITKGGRFPAAVPFGLIKQILYDYDSDFDSGFNQD